MSFWRGISLGFLISLQENLLVFQGWYDPALYPIVKKIIFLDPMYLQLFCTLCSLKRFDEF